jgi:hypothetical protein
MNDDTPEPSAPVSTPADALGAVVEAAVDEWMRGEVANSPVARSTEAYNYLVTVKGALVSRLASAISNHLSNHQE